MTTESQQNIQQKKYGYARYIRSTRANLHYWHNKLVEKSEAELQELIDQFPIVCRAIRMGLNFKETEAASIEFTTKVFNYVEQVGDYEEWSFLLKQIIDKKNIPIELNYRLYSHLAQFYKMGGRTLDALEIFSAIIKSTKSLGDELQNLSVRVDIASCYLENGNFEEAARSLEGIINDLDIAHAPSRLRITAYTNLAWLASQYHLDFQKADQLFQQALLLCDDSTPTRVKISVLRMLGELHSKMGNYEQAIVDLESAEELLNTSNLIRERTLIQLSLGGIAFQQNRWHEAAERFSSIPLEKLEISGLVRIKAVTLNNLGYVYGKLRLWDRASNYLRNSLLLWKALDDNASYANSLGSLGEVYMLQGDIIQGVQMVKDTLQLLRAMVQTEKIQRWIKEFEEVVNYDG